MSALEVFGIVGTAIGIISVGWAVLISVRRRAKITRKYFVVGRTKASEIKPQQVLGFEEIQNAATTRTITTGKKSMRFKAKSLQASTPL